MRHAKPAALNLNAAPFYIVIRRHKLGWYLQECDISATSRADTIADICGDPEDVAMVLELESEAHGEGGHWRDATSDLAKDIADRAASDGHPISPALYEFISSHAGLDVAQGLRTFDPTFQAA